MLYTTVHDSSNCKAWITFILIYLLDKSVIKNDQAWTVLKNRFKILLAAAALVAAIDVSVHQPRSSCSHFLLSCLVMASLALCILRVLHLSDICRFVSAQPWRGSLWSTCSLDSLKHLKEQSLFYQMKVYECWCNKRSYTPSDWGVWQKCGAEEDISF